MKRTVSKRNSIVKLTAVSLFITAMIGCGFVASVPWITNADNNQVVNIGDSIFALSGEINDFLHSYAGQTFRRYAVSGAELTGGVLAPSLYSQYDIAKGDNPNIDIIIMDGGGNDILLPAIAFDPYDCKTQWYEWGRLSSSCKNFIDDIYVDCVNLLNDMHADGVNHVIYQGYYYTKNTWLLQLDDLEEAIDYGDAKLALACQNSSVDCRFIDPRSTIKDSDIKTDAIHPTTSGSQKLANLIWPVLAPLL
ncbi:MAG: SGNH/GDSL hydrolase family protein [Pseudomonadota bacterium]